MLALPTVESIVGENAIGQAQTLQVRAAAEDNKLTVLILIGHYLPGFKAGGSVRSVANLVNALGSEFRFAIVTSDRDLDDRSPYPRVSANCWMRVGNADVMYLSPDWRGLRSLISLLLFALHRNDILYLNSFFSRRFSILPMLFRRLGLLKTCRIVLAPRGELSSGALGLKSRRKVVYITLSRWFRTHCGIVWHASTEHEAMDIKEIVRDSRIIDVAEALAPVSLRDRERGLSGIMVAEDIAEAKRISGPSGRIKVSGSLHIVFVSRISPVKNLLGALKMLDGVRGDVSFNIYGPAEDKGYWAECQEAIASMQPNIRVKYFGMVDHQRVSQVFAENDLLFLPTLGENYGHVICEALFAGCPVLISNRTPWRNLAESNAGWDLSLEDTGRFRTVLQECVDADQARQMALSIGALSFAQKSIVLSKALEANRGLLQRVGAKCTQKALM
jgi:glycosyltransferase involved in cell wall biosynthesis